MNITTLSISEFQAYYNKAKVSYGFYKTEAGTLLVLITDLGVFNASFCKEDQESSFQTKNYSLAKDLDTSKVILIGTDFQVKVWKALLAIPDNSTISYQQLAHNIGHPKSWRAVANAVASNNLAYFIPCHKVVRKNGQLGGYKWGTDRKLKLLNKFNLF